MTAVAETFRHTKKVLHPRECQGLKNILEELAVVNDTAHGFIKN